MLYIILPVFNRKDITLNFIDSLQNQTFSNWTLLLIDDGSTDGTPVDVKSRGDSRIQVIETKGDLWWGGSLQYAYQHLRKFLINKDNVLIINDDVIINNDYLEQGLYELANTDNTAFISECYDFSSKAIVDKGVVFNPMGCTFIRNKSSDIKINCGSTRGLFINGGDFLNSGGIDSYRFPHYLSDYDFVLRLIENGLNIGFSERVFLYSDQSTTGEHELPSFLHPINILNTLNSNRCSLNYKCWIRFINKHTSNKLELIVSYIRFHALVLKKILHF